MDHHPDFNLIQPADAAFSNLIPHTVVDHGVDNDPDAIPSQSPFAPPSTSSSFAPVVRQDGSSAAMGMFQCSFCKKCYNRADHLQRHVRSHSGEKPYPCKFCNKSFGRPDLLKRHAEGHAADREDGSKRRKLNVQSASSNRVTQACKACSASKLKCDEAKPCGRCQVRGFTCEPVGLTPSASNDPNDDQTSVPIESVSPAAMPFRTEDQLPTPTSSDLSGWNDNIIESDQGFFPDIPGVKWTLSRSLRIAADYLDQGMATPVMPSYNAMTQEPYDWTNANFNEENFRSSVRQALSSAQISSLGVHRELQKSNSESSEPRMEDSDFRDQINLALPQPLPKQARRKPHTQLLRENLDYSARDRLLYIVTRNVIPENIEKISRSFPATELYDDFMQHFFNIFSEHVDSWIHPGTFKPNSVAAELLAAIVATGAVYQEQHVLRTIGYAMLEQARLQIPKTIDLHSNLVRELEVQQAYLLQLETRLYCANRKKTEMAEALFQASVTMLRRGRQFRRHEYETVIPDHLHDGESLNDRWRKWARQEERKRTVYHMLIHDARTSAMFNTTPLVSSSDFSLPLPESDALWRARSAQEWQSLYQQRGSPTPTRLPSLFDAMQDQSCLAANSEYLDINFSLLIVIHATWALIMQHREYKAFQPHCNWQNPGPDSSAYSRCLNILTNIGSILPLFKPLRPEVMIIYSFVFANLHVSMDELHLYAGKADREDAQRTFYSAKYWFESSSARQAVFHAGQLLQYARQMPRFTIRDFYITTFFNCVQILWSYGILSRGRRLVQQQQQQQPPRTSSDPSSNYPIMLDSDNVSPDLLHSFINDGRGNPCISHYRAQIAVLEEPSLVCDELQHTLQNNWDQGPPEMLRGMRKLIMDLGNTAKMG